MNIDNIWNRFLSSMKKELNSMSFDTWFGQSKLVELNEEHALIIVPSEVHKKHLTISYMELIEEIFNKITGTNFNIELMVEKEYENKKNTVDKNNDTDNIDEEVGVPFNSPEKANLNPDYTFENFIVGESNRFAQATALAVAENPGKMYNPLFIYGNSGLGKTHLMQAIGNYIIQYTNKRVLYVTSDQFINDFLGLNKKNKDGTNFDYVDLFKDKYRNIDVLIIDDIQFLGNAPKTQNEFFHTFNNLYDNRKQIIISSDTSPDDLKHLEDRLRTRFNWGLKVSIYPPDNDLRKEILRKKMANMEISNHISEDAIEYIANMCSSDVRSLEGALTRVCAYSTIFYEEEITLELAVEALKGTITPITNYKNDIQRIQRVVAEYYNVSVDDLKSKKRVATITFPRQIAIYLSRHLTDESLPKIGMEFGGRDHSTVIHSIDKIEKDIKENKQLEKIINEIKKKLE
jgi:chromosomal replication initiator protein